MNTLEFEQEDENLVQSPTSHGKQEISESVNTNATHLLNLPEKNPEEHASIFQRLFFMWVGPLLEKGDYVGFKNCE